MQNASRALQIREEQTPWLLDIVLYNGGAL